MEYEYTEPLTESEYIGALIEDLLFFIDDHPSFNGKIVDEIIDYYEKNEKLTPKQYISLVEIYEKWRVGPYIRKKKYRDIIDYD
jgi:hypothetical protein